MRDERAALSKLLLEVESRNVIEIDLVIVRSHSKVLTIRRELKIFDPLFRDLFQVDKLPVLSAVDA